MQGILTQHLTISSLKCGKKAEVYWPVKDIRNISELVLKEML